MYRTDSEMSSVYALEARGDGPRVNMIAREIRAEFQLARALRFCTRLAQVTVGLQQISFASALSSGSEVIPYWAASLRFTLLGCTCFFTRVVYWYSTNSFALLRCFFEFGSNWFHIFTNEYGSMWFNVAIWGVHPFFSHPNNLDSNCPALRMLKTWRTSEPVHERSRPGAMAGFCEVTFFSAQGPLGDAYPLGS